MPLSREATADAYRRHRALHDDADWPALADLFAEDGRYSEPFFGEIEGREAVRAFLVKSMTGLEAWTFPILWTVIDEGRVVTQWQNRLPGRRRDGGYFEFPGITTLAYNDAGEIIHQSDAYDRLQALQIIAEGRSQLVEQVVSAAKVLERPLVMGLHWLTANTSRS